MAADYTFSPSDIYALPVMGEVTVVSYPASHPVDDTDGGVVAPVSDAEKDHNWTYPNQFIHIQEGSNPIPLGRGVVGLIYPRGI